MTHGEHGRVDTGMTRDGSPEKDGHLRTQEGDQSFSTVSFILWTKSFTRVWVVKRT